jgi:hypothetical protein
MKVVCIENILGPMFLPLTIGKIYSATEIEMSILNSINYEIAYEVLNDLNELGLYIPSLFKPLRDTNIDKLI